MNFSLDIRPAAKVILTLTTQKFTNQSFLFYVKLSKHCESRAEILKGGHEKNPHFEFQCTFGTKLTKSGTVSKYYVCMCFFISQPQQHKSKHKNTSKADKKEAVKNDIRYRTCKQYIVQI